MFAKGFATTVLHLGGALLTASSTNLGSAATSAPESTSDSPGLNWVEVKKNCSVARH
jgi:hypothetical protein